jgi:hypothetical protein
MTIPDTIHIGGLPYMVFKVEPSVLGIEHEGENDYRNQTITICDSGTDYNKITFLHECVHGMIEALGIPTQKQDEALVDGLAHQLYQLLEDNPALLEKEVGEDDE